MLFNSIEYFLFLFVVFLVYWLVLAGKLHVQNTFLLFAGYFFDGYWDWRFLFLLIGLTLINYMIGLKIDRSAGSVSRRIWLIIAVVVNVGVLGLFKYYNFFIDSFVDLLSVFGFQISGSTATVVLPLGISFYIFVSLSYVIDIYKGYLKANRNAIEVLLALSFFPIILAGPIQRPVTLLPQITKMRVFNRPMAVDGLRQILWGLFVKMVVADNIAPETNKIFLDIANYSGSTLLLGAFLYTIQIYADFSGYSHIAIGTARLLGFSLMQNFNYPYFSHNISEFWKRWHISLTTWFRDYLFLPISFALSSKISRTRVFSIKTDLFIYIIASIFTWLLTGLWHGANYTFIIWGSLNGVLLIIYHWQIKPRKRILKLLNISNKNKVLNISEGVITFIVILFFWIFFRADSLRHAMDYVSGIFTASIFSVPDLLPKTALIATGFFLSIEYIQREKQHPLQIGVINNRPLRWSIYLVMVLVIIFFGAGAQEFIYFQF